MKSTAKRFGKAPPGAVVAAKADNDSSHGRHIVTPTPRSTVRRSILGCVRSILVRLFARGIGSAFRQALRAGDNGLDQGTHAIPARGESRVHPLTERLIREQQGAAQRVYQHFTVEIVQEILFSVCTN